MKATRIIGIIILIISFYLLWDSNGVNGASDNHSEVWLGSIFLLLGIWFCITKKNII